MEQRRFALLIDSENISAKYISTILYELAKHGIVTYKRIYGDWTTPQAAKWREKILEYALTPIQQFRNTIGKNATDSALIIDAMDILYTNRVEGFCIVSSDGDFTRLASRLRESGMNVIGMGEEKCPLSFRVACSTFIDLENKDEDLIDLSTPKLVKKEKIQLLHNQKEDSKAPLDKQDIEEMITNLILEREKNGKRLDLGELGSLLSKQYPGFKVKHYGYSLLSKFVQDMEAFEVSNVKNKVSIRLKVDHERSEELYHYIKSTLGRSKTTGIELGELENTILKKYKKFNIHEYGYKNLRMLVNDIEDVIVKPKNGTSGDVQMAYLKKYVKNG